MKKYILSFICVMFLFIGGVRANTVNKIDMDVYIDKNGDAYVKEVWDVETNESTEVYHQYNNIGESSISDLKVSDSTKEYEQIDWDINASFDSKAYKYGYNYTDSGVELCWGISKYGTNTYYVTYKINGFVYNVEDAQIVYWTLVPSISSGVKHYYVKIHADERFSDKLDVWGYGKYGAYAYVYDGYIELTADEKLDGNEYVTVLVKFDEGTFNTQYNLDYDFDNVLEMAKKGSSPYEEKMNWKEVIITLFEYLFIPFIIISFFFNKALSHSGKLYKKTIPKKDIPAFRDFPCGDDMFKAYFIATEYRQIKNKTDFLGTLLLKWLKEDIISITTEEKGIFKTKTTKIMMPKEVTELPFTNKLEANIYGMMRIAAEDGILEQNEFNKYCRKHYEKVLQWFDDCIDDEYNKIKVTDYVVKESNFKNKYSASAKLDELGLQMAGLKKFYKEFGSIYDKEAIQVKLWREHLMYAQIFGMAKEVAKEFKALYPNEILAEDIDRVVLINDFSYNSMSTATSAKSRAESYSSGGGGFSSGGGGGGSFGGGSSGGFR